MWGCFCKRRLKKKKALDHEKMINIDATCVHIVLDTLTPQEEEVGGMFNTINTAQHVHV